MAVVRVGHISYPSFEVTEEVTAMTRRSDVVPDEAPDFLTVDELAAVLRISRNRAYQLVRLGVATDGRDGVAAQRVDKQFRISRYVIEERLGGPITWPIPGFHNVAETKPVDAAVKNTPAHPQPASETADAKPVRHRRPKPLNPAPDTQLQIFSA